ncbi:hypothetical protein E2C01_034868 [Portunus trituberculatus]|uniref:Uncharacterized protein n=1 Tax=Portunus trituberculatus TaxID=210409 RepID=A0A5B7F1P1_PORTR|nr:hypothetical protein [Portunus trituberculatus]
MLMSSRRIRITFEKRAEVRANDGVSAKSFLATLKSNSVRVLLNQSRAMLRVGAISGVLYRFMALLIPLNYKENFDHYQRLGYQQTDVSSPRTARRP